MKDFIPDGASRPHKTLLLFTRKLRFATVETAAGFPRHGRSSDLFPSARLPSFYGQWQMIALLLERAAVHSGPAGTYSYGDSS